jgi:Icc-related predicted phosphoesterase
MTAIFSIAVFRSRRRVRNRRDIGWFYRLASVCSSRLAETIDRFPVSAVVHGHAHRGVYEGRTPRGVPVYNVAKQILKPSGQPYALLQL